MPLLDLQRRVTEVGRIRLGASTRRDDGRKLPQRLKAWRLTSRDQLRLEAAAELYGGTVKPWDEKEGEFVLDTEKDQLPIVLLADQGVSQYWELWGQRKRGAPNECLRRCDGVTEILSGKPCMCPPYDDRIEAAKTGKACKPYTRLSVILPEVAGVGLWRLESSGYHAAVELAGTAEMLQAASAAGTLLRARLRIDWRKTVRDGTTNVFPVPIIDIDVRVGDVLAVIGDPTSRALAAGDDDVTLDAASLPALEAGFTPAPPPPPSTATIGDALTNLEGREPRERSARSAEPVGEQVQPPAEGSSVPVPLSGADEPEATAPEPTETEVEGEVVTDPDLSEEAERLAADHPDLAGDSTTETPPSDETRSPGRQVADRPITDAQRRRLWAIVGENGVSHDDLRAIVVELTGQDSTASIPKRAYENVITAIQAKG